MNSELTSKPLLITRMDGPEDSTQEEVFDPTWQDVETAIRRLDGNSCSLLILGIGDPVPHMGIGGGEDGKYIVYATRDNMEFHNLINPKSPAGKILLVAGGQRGDYALRQCVSLMEVLLAARTYAETGELDPSLTWEKQG